jgi:Alpha/beta hydrolase family
VSLNFVLVPGPLVRASSWEPAAKLLRQSGHNVQIPDVLDNQPPPAWRSWTSHLLQRIAPCHEPILVGHSSASALVADLAHRLPCRCVIVVDGDVPPSRGAASPVRPALRDFIGSIAGSDGSLPVWSRWFAADAKRASVVGLELLAKDPVAFAEFERGLPRLSVDWFDDTIKLAGWDHVPAGFIQCSPIYDHAATDARRRGWPVIKLDGTHLHPTLEPAETMFALLSMSRQLDRAAPASPLPPGAPI